MPCVRRHRVYPGHHFSVSSGAVRTFTRSQPLTTHFQNVLLCPNSTSGLGTKRPPAPPAPALPSTSVSVALPPRGTQAWKRTGCVTEHHARPQGHSHSHSHVRISAFSGTGCTCLMDSVAPNSCQSPAFPSFACTARRVAGSHSDSTVNVFWLHWGLNSWPCVCWADGLSHTFSPF
jgi:hypothetical protein